MFKNLDGPRWRPRPAWLPMGVGLGLGSGAVVGAVVMSTSGVVSTGGLTGVAGFLLLGAVFGGGFGLLVGALVGTAMVFLVGAHLTREQARSRAFVLGAVLPAFALTLVLVGPGADPVDLVSSPVPLAAGLLGGPLAAWAAGVDVRLPDLAEVHRDEAAR